MQKDPVDGGCWFCHTDDGDMSFTAEFDAYFHMQCLKNELQAVDFENPEAKIIAAEFGVNNEQG